MTEDEVFTLAGTHTTELARESSRLVGGDRNLMRTYWLRIAQGALSAGYLMARQDIADEGAEEWLKKVFSAFFYDVKSLGGPSLRLKIEIAEEGETFTGA